MCEIIRQRLDAACGNRVPLLRRIAAIALTGEIAPHLAPHHRDNQRADQRRRLVEEAGRALVEILVDHPAIMHDRPVEMILAKLLEGPGSSDQIGVATLVEVEAVFLLDMEADQRRIRDELAAILLEYRKFSLGRVLEIGGLGRIGDARHPEQRMRLENEGAGIDEPEGGTKDMKYRHNYSLHCCSTCEKQARP